MATRKSENYSLTLQDNDEFVDIETTAANFENLDRVIKEIDDKLFENGKALEEVQANGYSHPEYTERASGLYKIAVDKTGHVSNVAKVTKTDITNLGVPGTNTVYSHPTYTNRASGLYKITVDGTGHVSSVTPVTKADITALGIPGSNSVYTHPTYTDRAFGLYKITVNGEGHVIDAIQVNKWDIVSLGIPSSDTVYTHPKYTVYPAAFYKVGVDNTGHVESVKQVTKADITALGIPGTVDDAETVEDFAKIKNITASQNPISTRMALKLYEASAPVPEVLFEGAMGVSSTNAYGDPTQCTINNLYKFSLVTLEIGGISVPGTVTLVDSENFMINASLHLLGEGDGTTYTGEILISSIIHGKRAGGKVTSVTTKYKEMRYDGSGTSNKQITKITGII